MPFPVYSASGQSLLPFLVRGPLTAVEDKTVDTDCLVLDDTNSVYEFLIAT